MGYARHIGRIGALAVALGAAAAIASTPAIGYASPADSGSSTSDSSPGTSSTTPTDDATTPKRGSGAAADDGGDGKAPTVVVRSSGGAHTSGDDGDIDTDDTSDDSATDGTGTDVNADEQDAQDVGTTRRDRQASRVWTLSTPDAAPSVSAVADAAPVSRVGGGVVSALSDAVSDFTGRVGQASGAGSPLTAVSAPVSSLLASVSTAAAHIPVPPAVDTLPSASNAVDVVTNVVRSPLGLVGGLIPGAPDAPSSALWALAAAARREIGVDGQDASTQPANLLPQEVVPTAIDPSGLLGEILIGLTDGIAGIRDFAISTFFRPAPTARDQEFSTGLNQSVSATFDATTAFPNEDLVYTVNNRNVPGGPKHGTVTVVNNNFIYQPEPGFTGVDTFSYVASDNTTLDPHLHLFDSLNSKFGIFGTSFLGGHRDTGTVTVFVNQPDTSHVTGELTVVSYNIGGLPFPINFLLNDTTTQPRWTSMLDLSNRLNQMHLADGGRPVVFDVVNMQEDFAFHPLLMIPTLFPDATAPQLPPDYLWPYGVPFIAGLNTFSTYEIKNVKRISFDSCASFNCLTPKGFTYKQIHLPGGETVDVYNLHTDSGGFQSTNDQIAQVSQYIQQNSQGRAVIVTADWNELYSQVGYETLSEFATDNGLADAWVLQEYGGTVPTNAPDCPNANNCEQLDKIFFRSSAETIPGNPASRAVVLDLKQQDGTYVGYQNFGSSFENGDGTPLSDHRPVAATLVFRALNNTPPPPTNP